MKKMLSMGVSLLNSISVYTTTEIWKVLGRAGFSARAAYGILMAIEKDGTPYVVYADCATGSGKITVIKYNESN